MGVEVTVFVGEWGVLLTGSSGAFSGIYDDGPLWIWIFVISDAYHPFCFGYF